MLRGAIVLMLKVARWFLMGFIIVRGASRLSLWLIFQNPNGKSADWRTHVSHAIKSVAVSIVVKIVRILTSIEASGRTSPLVGEGESEPTRKSQSSTKPCR